MKCYNLSVNLKKKGEKKNEHRRTNKHLTKD